MATETKPRVEVFHLKTPLLSEGRTNKALASTDLLKLRIKVYAEGGENSLHTHLDEDHAFVVLEGQASFHDEEGTTTIVDKHQGIMLPKGTLYYFQSTGDTNLVLLRAGAGRKAEGGYRRNLQGNQTTHEENKHEEGVPIPRAFFGA